MIRVILPSKVDLPLKKVLLVSCFVVVSGCQTTGGSGPMSQTGADQPLVSSAIERPESAVEALTQEGKKALIENDFRRASQLFNLALKLDITNPDLQFLNSYAYHLIGVTSDSTKLALAEQGFKLALKFDPGHVAANHQLALLYMDQRRYVLAQPHLARVALSWPDNPDVLYGLAVSSYYAQDPLTAEAALKRLAAVDPERSEKPHVLRANALIKAAVNAPQEAARYLEAYREKHNDSVSADELGRRLFAWSQFYEHDAQPLLAQFEGDPFAAELLNEFDAADDGPLASDDPFGTSQNEPQMVVVDVVLIGTQEDARDARGINLLDGLQLQFGDPLTGTPGYSWTTSRVRDNRDSGLGESLRTITRSINIPAVTYSLNIANSADADNEILAKPSLVAQSGETSEFFSGTEILAAAVSGGDGDSVSVQKEVGVKLAITPEALDDDLLRLHVVAERTFLTDPSNSVVFEFRLDTTKTNVNATVTMRYGETLILGGLSEREVSNSADGVPLLMDVPGLNLLFSERAERRFERSILILMTPRRPQYTNRSPVRREQTNTQLSELERNIERFARRNQDWYTPRPTFEEVFNGLRNSVFIEEFRQGDLSPQSWRTPDSEDALLTSVLERLDGLDQTL